MQLVEVEARFAQFRTAPNTRRHPCDCRRHIPRCNPKFYRRRSDWCSFRGKQMEPHPNFYRHHRTALLPARDHLHRIHQGSICNPCRKYRPAYCCPGHDRIAHRERIVVCRPHSSLAHANIHSNNHRHRSYCRRHILRRNPSFHRRTWGIPPAGRLPNNHRRKRCCRRRTLRLFLVCHRRSNGLAGLMNKKNTRSWNTRMTNS